MAEKQEGKKAGYFIIPSKIGHGVSLQQQNSN